MPEFDFQSIAPYDPEQVSQAVQRILDYPQFLNNLAYCIYKGSKHSTARLSRTLKESLPVALKQVRTWSDFQKQITCRYLIPIIENNSIDLFTFDGVDKLDRSKTYTFISNHRDIVLDCTLLDYALFYGGFDKLCEMCLGDNLMKNSFSTDMFKLNGGVTVMRSLPSKEALSAARNLSAYLNHALHENRSNIWIAQKSGRSKDGIDNTSTAVLKMLYLDYRNRGLSFAEAVREMNIVPVVISYQYDPCDVHKGREQIKRLKNEGVYKKSKYEDVLNLLHGLRRWKGNVHLRVGTPLPGEYETATECAAEIDRQIHLKYRLWDTNWFCYDYINGTKENADKYPEFHRRSFLHRFRWIDSDVKRTAITGYANPVISYLNALKDEQ